MDDSNVNDKQPDVSLALRILKSLPLMDQDQMFDEMSVENRKQMLRLLLQM